MRFIDTHQHVIYRDHFGYAWSRDLPQLGGQSFTFEDYDRLTEGCGVIGTIFMEAAVDDADYQAEARFVASRVGSNNLLGQIASCRPEINRGFEPWLEEAKDLGIVGYRRILHEVDDEMSRSDDFRANIRKIGAAGLPFDMCFQARQLPIAAELARHCDAQTLVLDHCGVPDIAGGAFDSWAADMAKLAEMEHIVVKLSGITAYCAADARGVETLTPWVQHVLATFGPSRMIWGGDWPVVNLGSGLPEWISLTREMLADLSPDEQSAITEKNARIVYGLGQT